MVRSAMKQVRIARWGSVYDVLDDDCIHHRGSHESETDSDAYNRLEVDVTAMEEWVKPSLNEWSEYDATNLVHRWQKVVGSTSGFHLGSLRDKIVLHLIEADIKHNKGDAG